VTRKLRPVKRFRLRIVWGNDAETKKLVDEKVKKSIEYNKWRIFDRVAFFRKILSADIPDTPDMRPFMEFQATDEERHGGTFNVYVDEDGVAWIQWQLSLADMAERYRITHQIPAWWTLITHSVADIQEEE
jgi:hypothetical protein